MNPHLTSGRVRTVSHRRRDLSSRFRPACEGLEERVVMSTGVVEAPMVPATAHHFVNPHAGTHPAAAAAHAGAHHKVARHAIQHGPRGHAKLPATPAAHVGRLTPVVAAPSPTTAAPPVSAPVAAAPPATTTPAASDPTLVTLDLKPLDVNLLGLEVKTSEIKVTVSAQPGSGQLLGNLLTDVSGLLNLQGVSNALNSVLGNVVTLANSASLSVNLGNSTGPGVPVPAAATTPVLSLHVAPVNLDLLGAIVTTSPIDVSIVAHSGKGLILGNVVSDLANLLNGQPNDQELNIDAINKDLGKLLKELNAQIPGINATPAPTPAPLPAGTSQILSLTVPPIDLNLLGLVLQTDQIQVNADAQTGNGNLLGNLLNQALNTLGATPQNLGTLNSELNALLAKVVTVLNHATLTLPSNALGSLSQTLQQLALPNLVNTTGASASAPVLNLDIAATSGDTQPPVDVNLLGLVIQTNNIHAQLTANTGNGQILGNLVYNVSHLLDPGGSLNLLGILGQLGL